MNGFVEPTPNDLGELPQVIEDYLNLSRVIARV